MRLVDPHLRSDRPGGLAVVAAQHQGADAECVQVGDRRAAAGSDGVGDGEQRMGTVLAGQHHRQHHDRLAVGFEGVQAGLQRFVAQAALVDQAVVAEQPDSAADHAAHAASRQGFEIRHLGQRDAIDPRRFGHRARYRVIGACGEAGGQLPRGAASCRAACVSRSDSTAKSV